jgi:Spy/CpxP family protein refolding chaperone
MKKQVLVTLGFLAMAGVVAAAGMQGPGPGARRAGRMGGGPGGPGGPDLPKLKEQLGLSDAQLEQLRTLRADHQKIQIRRRADQEIARLELHQLMTATALDEKAVAVKVKELGDLGSAALKARVDSHLALRKVLTPEQQKKMHELRPMMHRGGEPGMRPSRGGRPSMGPGRQRGADAGPWMEEGAGPGPDDAALTEEDEG